MKNFSELHIKDNIIISQEIEINDLEIQHGILSRKQKDHYLSQDEILI